MRQMAVLVAALLAVTNPLRADSPESVTIPLTLEQLSTGGYKLGISISLGGGAFKLYEFDTGANGFYAANNTAWWSNFTTVSPAEVTQTYATGISYNATIVTTTLDFGYGLPVVTANMAQIQSATGSDVPNWDFKVANDIPPLWDHFFGDFGSALGHNNGLFAILPQLPGNLANGFIVRTGGFANPNPSLQIGISDADRSLFPLVTPMQGANHTVLFPNSGLDTYQGKLISGNASFFNGTDTVAFPTDFLLDTGAPSMVVFDNGGSVSLPTTFLTGNSEVLAGINTTISSGGFSLNFPAGNISGLNLITDIPTAGGDINTGLIPFFQYDVMFDVQQGYVRFAPATIPEPASASLLAGLILGVGGLFIRRRRVGSAAGRYP